MPRVRASQILGALALLNLCGCLVSPLTHQEAGPGQADRVTDLLSPAAPGKPNVAWALPGTAREPLEPEAWDKHSVSVPPPPPEITPAVAKTTCASPTVRSSVSTVLSPEAPGREISLAECIALALENGRTGDPCDRADSGRRTGGPSRPGLGRGLTDSIRVLSYEPAVLGTEIEQALARFDVVWQTRFLRSHYDQPTVASGSDLFARFPGQEFSVVREAIADLGIFTNLDRLDTAQFRSSLLKPLPTGGVAGLTLRNTWYDVPADLANTLPGNLRPSNVNSPFLFTPAHRPAVDFTFEQPLLRGAGVLINQLRDTHPGSLLHPYLPTGQGPGILLARITHEQSKTEFERQIHELLFRVEEAYWELYCAYWDLYTREAGMKHTLAAWQLARARYEQGSISRSDLAEAEEQYQSLRIQRLEALGRGSPGSRGVLEAERRLRYVLGMAPEDGTRLIPCDTPVDTPCLPDWDLALADARLHRPELLLIQQDIQAAELTLHKAKDLLLPELRFIGKYTVNGLGHTLGEGLDVLADNRFNDWELGLVLQVPIGCREANSEVARAKLQVAQRFAWLRDQESRIILSLQRSHRDVVQFAEEIRLRRNRREAAAIQLQERTRELKSGTPKVTVVDVLQAQRKWIDASRDERVAVCNYNVARADHERQKGTILHYRNVTLAEGPLPVCAERRASVHIRDRNRALKVREREGPKIGGNEAPSVCSSAAAPAPQRPANDVSLAKLLDENKELPLELPPAPPGLADCVPPPPPPLLETASLGTPYHSDDPPPGEEETESATSGAEGQPPPPAAPVRRTATDDLSSPSPLSDKHRDE